MTNRAQQTLDLANDAQFCRLWSAHVDALDHHLSTDMWAVAAVTVAVISYPIAQFMIPSALHGMVPDVVRSVLHFI